MLSDITSDMPDIPPCAFRASGSAGRQAQGAPGSPRPTQQYLQIEDALRHDSAHHEIPERQCISTQPAAPIRIRLRPARSHQVHRHVFRDVPDSAAKRVAATFREQIERVCDLRVAKPDAGTTPRLNPEMHSAGEVDMYHLAECRELARQVNIFLPTIQRQTLVELQPMQAHRRCSERHVAAVRAEYRRSVGGSLTVSRQNGQRVVDAQTWPIDAIRENRASGHNTSWIGNHVLLDRCQIARMRQEIVIKKNHDVRCRRGSKYRIPLTRQTGICTQKFCGGMGLPNAFNVCRPCTTHYNPVRCSRLRLQVSQRPAQHARSTNRGQSNDNIESHELLQTPRIHFVPTVLDGRWGCRLIRTVNGLFAPGTIDHLTEVPRFVGRLG